MKNELIRDKQNPHYFIASEDYLKICIGDIEERNFLLDPNNNYSPINIDRDNQSLYDAKTNTLYPYDNLPPVVTDLLKNGCYQIH